MCQNDIGRVDNVSKNLLNFFSNEAVLQYFFLDVND
jgi:hypothetical protein